MIAHVRQPVQADHMPCVGDLPARHDRHQGDLVAQGAQGVERCGQHLGIAGVGHDRRDRAVDVGEDRGTGRVGTKRRQQRVGLGGLHGGI